MTDKQKIEILKSCFDDTIWMAIRYAHGRHTYAPSMVRDAVKNFKKVFPDWELKEDRVIQSPDEGTINGFTLRSDYLDDLFKNERTDMDEKSLKKLRERAFPKEYKGDNYPCDIRHCPQYEGYIPENLNHEVCGWCGKIHYYH